MSKEKVAATATAVEGPVVDQILSAFVAKIEAEPALAQAGGRLRRALLEMREDSEAGLKTAIFGGEGE